ncbi:HesA/MoeB/ThiF family protein [Candidatus Micrarchaeota archaeon]|nr:HesA/MoeB/ThiF family protein [Candidatus Micrarchaeota archaeon]
MRSLRYLRQERILGKESKKLRNASVGIVGIGGIGSNSALLCTQLGVEKLILVDRDFVQVTNLSRQSLFSERSIGKPKASEAEKILHKINSDVDINAYQDQLSHKNVGAILGETGVILDCTDNYDTRKIINEYAWSNKKTWIFASAFGMECMLSTVIPGKTPCFQCWAKEPEVESNCSEAGIMNTTTAFISSLQIQEMVNLLCFGKPVFAGSLFYGDLRNGIFHKKKLKTQKDCACCRKQKA